MFDFLGKTKYPDPAYNNAYEQDSQQQVIEIMTKEIHQLQRLVDAMCKVYVAQHAKEIASRHPDLAHYHTDDQPIINRAKEMELQRIIATAQADLNILTKTKYSWGWE